MKKEKRYLIDVQSCTDIKLATTQNTRFYANTYCLLKLHMLVKSARTVSRELYWEKRVFIGLTSYGQLRVSRQYFAAVQNLSSCCLPPAYGIEQDFSNYGS